MKKRGELKDSEEFINTLLYRESTDQIKDVIINLIKITRPNKQRTAEVKALLYVLKKRLSKETLIEIFKILYEDAELSSKEEDSLSFNGLKKLYLLSKEYELNLKEASPISFKHAQICAAIQRGNNTVAKIYREYGRSPTPVIKLLNEMESKGLIIGKPIGKRIKPRIYTVTKKFLKEIKSN